MNEALHGAVLLFFPLGVNSHERFVTLVLELSIKTDPTLCL